MQSHIYQCAQLTEATAAHLAAAAPVRWIGLLRTQPHIPPGARTDMDTRGFSFGMGIELSYSRLIYGTEIAHLGISRAATP
jgi:hypothetical protein